MADAARSSGKGLLMDDRRERWSMDKDESGHDRQNTTMLPTMAMPKWRCPGDLRISMCDASPNSDVRCQNGDANMAMQKRLCAKNAMCEK